MPLTPGCLPICDAPPPPVCPPVNGTSPDLLAATTLSVIDLTGVVTGGPVRCEVFNSGNSAIILEGGGVLRRFDGFDGLVQNFTQSNVVTLDGLFGGVGFVTLNTMALSTDGMRIYTYGLSTVLGPEVVIQWNMTSAFDITAITSFDAFVAPPQPGSPWAVIVSNNGTLLTKNSGNQPIRQYNLADPDLVSTAAFVGSVPTATPNPRDFSYNFDQSTLMFTRFGGGDGVDARMDRFTLTTPGEIIGSIPTIQVNYNNIVNLSSTTTSSFLIPNQTQMYFMGTNRILEQFSLIP